MSLQLRRLYCCLRCCFCGVGEMLFPVLVGPSISVMRSSGLPATPSLAGPGIALSAVRAADLGSWVSTGVESGRRGEGGTVP